MDRYAVIGHPINHSKSPFIHTLFARQTQQHMCYEAIELAKDGFIAGVSELFANGLRGCNVTVPFKQQAYQFAHQLTDRARVAHAVNTLKMTDDGLILGDNTDGAGLLTALDLEFGSLADRCILLLGAGGAARGVIGPLLAANPRSLVIANRTHDKAQALAEQFSTLGGIEAMSLTNLDGRFDLIINATSASLAGQRLSLPARVIHPQVCCYDMMYQVGMTEFNQWAKQLGARQTIDGLGMLVSQAAESFAIWRGIRPGVRQVISEMRRNMNV
ncbi:shikimate dehydrogenase [Celerinatantimonas yamalensis]|uniref:Shikimate dehydrogenase (NADP(+)) n=1 Tax=Celerinatantimonas yamalensis TaxID=559956 RepID=A0ABW9GC39_9GAMM